MNTTNNADMIRGNYQICTSKRIQEAPAMYVGKCFGFDATIIESKHEDYVSAGELAATRSYLPVESTNYNFDDFYYRVVMTETAKPLRLFLQEEILSSSNLKSLIRSLIESYIELEQLNVAVKWSQNYIFVKRNFEISLLEDCMRPNLVKLRLDFADIIEYIINEANCIDKQIVASDFNIRIFLSHLRDADRTKIEVTRLAKFVFNPHKFANMLFTVVDTTKDASIAAGPEGRFKAALRHHNQSFFTGRVVQNLQPLYNLELGYRTRDFFELCVHVRNRHAHLLARHNVLDTINLIGASGEHKAVAVGLLVDYVESVAPGFQYTLYHTVINSELLHERIIAQCFE
jgi:hypothetical protein